MYGLLLIVQPIAILLFLLHAIILIPPTPITVCLAPRDESKLTYGKYGNLMPRKGHVTQFRPMWYKGWEAFGKYSLLPWWKERFSMRSRAACALPSCFEHCHVRIWCLELLQPPCSMGDRPRKFRNIGLSSSTNHLNHTSPDTCDNEISLLLKPY